MTDAPQPDAALPIIDLADADEAGLVRAMGQAARGVGFFYVVGHGVAPDVTQGAFAAARTLFALPDGAKQAVSITRSADNCGYVGLGVERLNPDQPADVKEAFNIAVSPKADGRDPNLWPALDGFRPAMEAYRAAMLALSARLHRLLALELGLEADFFDAHFTRPMSTLRLLRYPPVAQADAAPGCGAHTDYGNITLLAQDAVGGLEVRRRRGGWVAAPPIAGALVCNIGDCLMRWSNDVYVSTPHRVTRPTAQPRYSIAYFSDPDPDALVACLPGCSSASRPPRYAPIRAADYMRSRFDATYAYRLAN